jgi:predicted Zn-dependent protease
MIKLSAFITLFLSLAACTSSPLDRLQVVLYSDADMAERGIRSYREMQAETPATADAKELQYVQCVANYVVAALDSEDQSRFDWEVTVFDNEQANAFAMPGGKIGVYNGLFSVAVNQHQLAAVMAHEVGHVLASHSNERASQSALRNIGVTAAQILGASISALEIFDVGTHYGIFLPFTRTQEGEADAIGVTLMSEAGFNPEESINLWVNMNANGGPRPPELLSTHPSPSSRMAELRRLMPPANALRDSANSRGLSPDCILF